MVADNTFFVMTSTSSCRTDRSGKVAGAAIICRWQDICSDIIAIVGRTANPFKITDPKAWGAGKLNPEIDNQPLQRIANC